MWSLEGHIGGVENLCRTFRQSFRRDVLLLLFLVVVQRIIPVCPHFFHHVEEGFDRGLTPSNGIVL